MSSLKNIALIGAAGQLGASILSRVEASKKFNITVITRSGSTSTFPPGTKVVNVDLTSLSALTTAFAGLDAVVSLVGQPGIPNQTLLFDAAVAAGVKHFLPSEFGSDIDIPSIAALPVFANKVAVRNHISAAVAAGAKTTYTYVYTSAFLDWGLEKGFLFDWRSNTPTIYDGRR